jgi:dTDP-glucose 4,6-dehydratase
MSLPYSCVLVSGGCGFVGSNLIRMILHLWPSVRVVNVDGLTYAGTKASLADIETNPRYHFVEGRVENAESVAAVMAAERPDAVIHLAAETHFPRSVRDPATFVTTNIVGTQVLLHAAHRAGVIRFLYASTDEAYGPTPESSVFTEDAPFNPSNPFAASKAAGDLLAQAYSRTYDLDVVITRATNTYGPYQNPEKLLPLAILNALDKEPVPIYGDGRHERDWLHVEDHCRALCEVLLRGRSRAAYNIAGRCVRTNLHVVRAVLTRLGESHSLIQHVDERQGHDRRYAVSGERLATELGWTPTRDFDDGLDETVDWYLSHTGWCRRAREGSYPDDYREDYGMELGGPRETQPR